MNIKQQFDEYIASGDPIIGISDEQRDWILPFIEKQKANWLRSEIEKLEGMVKETMEEYRELNQGLYSELEIAELIGKKVVLSSIITRYKEELKVLESK